MEDFIRNIVLRNAVMYGGKADIKSVMSSVMQNDDAKKDPKVTMETVKKIVEEINSISHEEQKAMAEDSGVDTERHSKEQREGLPELPNKKPNGEFIDLDGNVVTRFAPNPNAPLHLGSARPLVINGLYSKKYNGKFILRFDDTDPGIKKPLPEAYNWIIEDCKWLGFEPDLIVYASDRFDIYIERAKEMYDGGVAYICTCITEEWKNMIDDNKACPCREINSNERWQEFITSMKEGEAVLRMKTPLNHKNPAIRDFPILRIKENSDHPRIDKSQRLWPLYNLASAIDENSLGITHIIRGQEHTTNYEKQKYIFDFFGWEMPIAIHHGRLNIENMMLSKSEIREAIEKGELNGWDDPRCGTLMSLRKQGIKPETIVKIMEKVGIRPNDATIDAKNLFGENKKL